MDDPKEIDKWLKSGKYLPKILRDFHDQKDIFKAIHCAVIESENNTIRRPTWTEGHCYVIDVFLWFMARRGYTLQRSRQNLPFRDLAKDIDEINTYRANSFVSILDNAKNV